jgi:hypothetical protein
LICNESVRVHLLAKPDRFSGNGAARISGTDSKVFLGFLALIISAHIHRVMSDNKLYRHMTIKDLIRTMEKLKTQIVDGRRILFPLTKRQKQIYAAFGISPPV